MCGIFVYFCFGKQVFDFVKIIEGAKQISYRGPDETREVTNKESFWIFHRLSINDLSEAGQQPMVRGEGKDYILVCNGEIYNWRELIMKYKLDIGESRSDCSVIIPLYCKLGPEFVKELDGVFAFVLWDKKEQMIVAGRDPYGIRPLFYEKNEESQEYFFCSEWKGIQNLKVKKDVIRQFPPGCLLTLVRGAVEEIRPYESQVEVPRWNYVKYNEDIRKMLIDAVWKRIHNTDRPIGFLLSGGLDSSLIASIGAWCIRKIKGEEAKIKTFSIGLKGSKDLEMAREVSNYLKTDHHELIFDVKDGIKIIEKVINHLESYDTTTIRASIPQYLMCEWIVNNTDVRVVFSGEGADELLAGYYYFKYALNENLINSECKRLVNELHMYDILRTDRTTAGNGLEVRVPFLDLKLSKYLLHQIPEILKSSDRMGNLEKMIIRNAFEGWLPHSVLFRPKDAFSDSVGRRWRNDLIAYLKTQVVYDEKIKELIEDRYGNINLPRTEEEYYYRLTFEKFFPGCGSLIKAFWMPRWTNEKIDPSAVAIGASPI